MRILVVDDDSLCVTVALRFLRSAGHTSEGCADAESALQALRAQPWDAAILDYRMGPPDGLELAQSILQYWPTVKLIGTSAFGTPKTRAAFLKYGGVAFLDKPYRLENLLRVLELVEAVPRHVRIPSDR